MSYDCVVAFTIQPNDGAKCAPCCCSLLDDWNGQAVLLPSAFWCAATDRRPAKNSTWRFPRGALMKRPPARGLALTLTSLTYYE